MTHHRCIAIGASAGGYQLVLDIVSQLPENFSAPVFVVMHIPANEHSYLPEPDNTLAGKPVLPLVSLILKLFQSLAGKFSTYSLLNDVALGGIGPQ